MHPHSALRHRRVRRSTLPLTLHRATPVLTPCPVEAPDRGPRAAVVRVRPSLDARDFAGYLEELSPFIRRQARRASDGDRDLREDLVQEGMIALWLVNAARLAASTHAHAYLRRVIRNAMYKWLRTTSRQVPGSGVSLTLLVDDPMRVDRVPGAA